MTTATTATGRSNGIIFPRLAPVVISTVLTASALAGVSPSATTAGKHVADVPFYTASTPPNLYSTITDPTSHVEDLLELKSQTALTWDELAKLFGVTRRSLHNWTNGRPLTSDNEMTLARLRAFIATVRPNDPQYVRATLLAPTFSGKTVFDLLRTEQFDLAERELARLPRAVAIPSSIVPDEGRPHPMAYMDPQDIQVADRPPHAKARRLSISRTKLRGT